MANVRTQVSGSTRRVLTKVVNGQRRVSCSCCEVGCCMYPASLLGEAYADDDLPDVANGLQKNTPPVDAGEYGLVYYGDPNAITFGNQIVYLDGAWKEVIDFAIGSANECLFPAFEDDFADTYTTVGIDEVEVTVVRKELCVWEGQVTVPNAFGSGLDLNYTNILVYSGGFANGPFEYFDEPYELGGLNKWILSVSVDPLGGSSVGIKTGTQNNPIGSYPDSQEVFSVSA